jgi:acid stress-induced BolA-like protein IbaG/YrbA
MLLPETVKNYIAAGLQCDHIEVEGDGQHFYATIVSPEFRGLIMVKQQQKVYAVLGDRMKSEIHALSMKTYTPEKWAEMKATNG